MAGSSRRRAIRGSESPLRAGWSSRERPVRLAAPVLLGGLLALSAPAFAAPADAQTTLTQEEALELAFPADATIERRTAYLDEDEIAAASRKAGDARVEHGIVTYYVARAGGEPIGYAYFDAHRVRTLDEVLMVVVSPAGTISRIEVLQFREPREYLAPDRWLELFTGRALDDRLSTKGDIINLTGATLTADAVVRAARRVLALHETIHGGDAP